MAKHALKYPWANLLDYRNNLKFDGRYEALFLTASSNRQFRVGGRHYDKQITPFISLLKERGIRSFVLEDGYRGDFRLPRYNKSRFLPPYLNYLAVKSLYFAKPERPGPEGLRNFEEVASCLTMTVPGLRYSDLAVLTRRGFLVRQWANYLKRVLEAVQPRVGFVVCYYGPLGMAHNLACAEYGIPSVDIQHGLEGEYNIAYGRWVKVPPGGYEVLPKYFWCWGEEEAAAINGWSRKVKTSHTAVAGGNLLLDEFQRGSELSEYFDSRMKTIHDRSSKHILLSLQPINGLSPLFVEAIRRTPRNTFWWIRNHPDMQGERKKIQRLLASMSVQNWNLREATDFPLYTLLKYMDLHVTEYSAVVLEAERFGVPSIITHPSGRNFFLQQIERKTVFEASALEDLVSYVEKLGKFASFGNPKKKPAAFQIFDSIFSGSRGENGSAKNRG